MAPPDIRDEHRIHDLRLEEVLRALGVPAKRQGAVAHQIREHL